MPRKLAALLGVLALVSTLAGCSKKFTTQASFVVPEGTPSSQIDLITWIDAPGEKVRMTDRPQIGHVDIGNDLATVDTIQADPVTHQLLITPIQAFSPGTIRGIVLNRTGAQGVEIYRTDPNGGVRKLFDFALQPTHRWLDHGTDVYEFEDSDPKRPANASYYARGLIGGMGGSTSPLSAPSRATTSTFLNIAYQAERWGTPLHHFFFEADSNFYMQWSAVPNTARYLIQVFQYQTKTLNLQQRILTGAPAPLLTFDTHDVFVATVPSGVTAYKIGDPGATIFTFGTLHLRGEYYVRISAIDVNNQMIATTTGVTISRTLDLTQLFQWPIDHLPKDVYIDFSDPEVASATPPAYLVYGRGAYWVSPANNPVPQNGSMERTR